MKEELEDVYRGRQGTVLQLRGPSILLSRSGRTLMVTASIREQWEGPGAVDVRVSRLPEFDGNQIINSLVMLLVAAVGILFWRSHVGDANVDLYRWIIIAVFAVIIVTLLAVAHRDRKDSERVFPESEVERLRTRLKLRIGTESIYSR